MSLIILKRSLINCNFKAALQTSVLSASKPTSSFINKFLTQQYCNSQLPTKKYLSRETEHARSIIEVNAAYDPLIFNQSKLNSYISPLKIPTVENYFQNLNLKDLNISELCNLTELVHHKHLAVFETEPEFINKIFYAIKSRCTELNDDQLALVLKNLNFLPDFKYQKYDELKNLWSEFDNMCRMRAKTWEPTKIFYFMDLWYTAGLLKSSTFIFHSNLRLMMRPKRLTPQQVVQLLFYLSITRKIVDGSSLFNLEKHLAECIEELSTDELGIVAMGFFKTESIIYSDNIIIHMIEKLMEEINTVPELTLICIIKAIRLSLRVSLWERILPLLDNLERQIPRLTIHGSIHVSLLTTKLQFLHTGVLDIISQKLVDDIKTCRLKDMEKVVFPLSQLNYDPITKPCIYQSILNELKNKKREDEINEHPKAFIALIHYFCMKGLFDETFIKKILDIDFIRSVYGKHKYAFGREVLYIDTTVELEFPSYKGPRLPVDIRNYLSKRYSEYLHNPLRKKSTRHQLWHVEIKEIIDVCYGKKNNMNKYILPNHPRADIIINLDKNQKVLPLHDNLINGKDFDGPIKAPEGSNYHALVIGSKNMFLYNSQIPDGETTSKIKQLKILGFTPVVISSIDWPSKLGTVSKIKHLKNIIRSTVR